MRDFIALLFSFPAVLGELVLRKGAAGSNNGTSRTSAWNEMSHEILEAGCFAIVNDGVQDRSILDNPFVRYVPAYPEAMAAELESLMKSDVSIPCREQTRAVSASRCRMTRDQGRPSCVAC